MTWIKFALWLCGCYLAYYAAIILWDLMRGRRPLVSGDAQELTFEEHIEPARPELDIATDYQGSAVISSGGVSLKQLFNLAREEAVEFTRAVSF